MMSVQFLAAHTSGVSAIIVNMATTSALVNKTHLQHIPVLVIIMDEDHHPKSKYMWLKLNFIRRYNHLIPKILTPFIPTLTLATKDHLHQTFAMNKIIANWYFRDTYFNKSHNNDASEHDDLLPEGTYLINIQINFFGLCLFDLGSMCTLLNHQALFPCLFSSQLGRYVKKIIQHSPPKSCSDTHLL